MVQTTVCKSNPIKIIPSPYTNLTYHPFTGEVYLDGKFFAKIRNKVYHQKIKKLQKHIFWNLSLIKYFHPVTFICFYNNRRYVISYENLIKFGKIKKTDKDTIYINLNSMKVM